MRSIKDLKIYLLDINPEMCEVWEKNFGGASNVEIVCEEFSAFMEKHKEVDCVVSPANSYGFMDGGFDFALSCYFGDELEETVQQYIKDNLYYEQPVATSIIVDTPIKGIKLIHTPTMQVPSAITDYKIIYHCMRSTLITALNSGVKCVVIPAFGGGCGRVPCETISKLMFRAYQQINKTPVGRYGWEYAYHNNIVI